MEHDDTAVALLEPFNCCADDLQLDRMISFGTASMFQICDLLRSTSLSNPGNTNAASCA